MSFNVVSEGDSLVKVCDFKNAYLASTDMLDCQNLQTSYIKQRAPARELGISIDAFLEALYS